MMQSRLSLLLAAAACIQCAAVMTGYTAIGPVGQWVPTSNDKACESNAEGIKSTRTRGGVNSDADCRAVCERSGSCMAVDYYRNTQVCLLYDDACETPMSTADGASSFRLMRTSTWSFIDQNLACEGNKEGIKQIGAKGNVQSLEECQQACNRRGMCRAADYYRSTQYCIFYSRPCNTPLASHDGSSSFKISQQLGAQTVADMKHMAYLVAASEGAADEGSWVPINSHKSCEVNDENISPLEGVGGFLEDKSLLACQRLCIHYGENCKAIDYFRETGFCRLYPAPCLRPYADHDGAMSMMLSAKPLEWATIDHSKSCENNEDGITMLGSGRQETSLTSCKAACEGHLECAAIDYYEKSKWCNFYSEACTKPLSTSDSPSSYKIVRTKAAGQKTQSMRGSGFAVSNEISSRVE